jgi:putative tryptophan/tyrosine transport system substrate-binding protein
VKRREFIALLGGAATAWPFAARAQQPVPVVGFLQAGSPGPNAPRLAAFREGLSTAGFMDGRDVRIETRWSEGHEERLPELAADLVRARVDVIATPNSTAATRAAEAATKTIPIVFVVGDPLQLGFIASLNRPGGNATGISTMNVELTAKRLGLLHELVPQAARYFALLNPNSGLTKPIAAILQNEIPDIGRAVEIVYAGVDGEIDAAFAGIAQKGGGVLLVPPDEFLFDHITQLIALAARYAVPTIYPWREEVAAGGLMSYGPDELNLCGQAGIYVSRILKGEKPADLPVEQPTKFEFAINLKTAKALGITVPPGVLAIADEVIE